MVTEIRLKTQEEIKKEKDLSNGIYAVWFLGFVNGSLLITLIWTFLQHKFILGLIMLFLWFITLPPLKKDKFLYIWKEENKNE